MGQYLAWSILGARELKFCTKEVPGVKNDPTLGDHNLHKNIHVV